MPQALPSSLALWDLPVPRYTSYPTAPQFRAVEEPLLRSHLASLDLVDAPLSLYLHIPFCRSMCLFCGCSVILNRRPERQAAYVASLLREIDLTASCFSRPKTVSQLHFGGGTPTSLSLDEWSQLMERLRHHFHFAPDAELSVEVDPRNVAGDRGEQLRHLRALGFNRISFGVQDLDPRVQEAVKRRQSEAMTRDTYTLARTLQFEGISMDLIYGLPLQTAASFRYTAERFVEWQPDRISLFSYAQVPWIKQHQQAIRPEDLPSTEEKFQIYLETRETFLRAGYVAIGMDHFARGGDSLSIAYNRGALYRNFQGYSVEHAEHLLGFGVTSIGFVAGAFFQNVKTLEEYTSRIEEGRLPVMRGVVLTPEDHLRRWVIQEWMCRFEVKKGLFQERFGHSLEEHFAREGEAIARAKAEGLLEEDERALRATPLGRLFIRNIASLFDAYFTPDGSFSKGV